ncbi:MAG: heavy metal translocating P-type ATPase, partial [Magnetovibrio sp.]|nr:heavy metal translocating P-type ATPase [Magnetovibrio sp.]
MTALASRRTDPVDMVGRDCCDMGTAAADAVALGAARARTPRPVLPDPSAYVRTDANGQHHLSFFVDGLQCAACIRTIEHGLTALDGVDAARVNMSTGRLAVRWRPGTTDAADIAHAVQAMGYGVSPFDPSEVRDAQDQGNRALLASLAVAGFAAANVMLLSVSIWAGAFADMGPATRDLFHWISAAIALPAVAYAGRPFFRSALDALRHRRLNMDVPISVAVLLAAAMSLHQTILGREHAYFDASISLLFFLLVGRYLDHQARAKARSAATHLLGLSATSATVIGPDGQHRLVPARNVSAGTIVHVAAGAKVPVDGTVVDGRSTVDTGLVTGESLPAPAQKGTALYAGTINRDAPLTLQTTAAGEDTLLAEIVRLVETAELGRSRYVRLADRAAAIYAPLVHVLALAAFGGWWLIGAAGLETSVMIAVAVLIITCPCALGLAVPAVQVVATGVLLKAGVLAKSRDGLERLAAVDTVVFDKTGTLTAGRPELANRQDIDPRVLVQAAALARHSTHPMSRAVVRAAVGPIGSAEAIQETPGFGLEGRIDGTRVRLGNAEWCEARDGAKANAEALTIWFRRGDDDPVALTFSDLLRADAAATVRRLRAMGLEVELLSGDRIETVAKVAADLGIAQWQGQCLPAAKSDRLTALAAQGRRVLMVGDGLNDAPALAAGHASMSPASGTEISQAAADFVFQGEGLAAVTTALRVARRAQRLVKQNIGLAILY